MKRYIYPYLLPLLLPMLFFACSSEDAIDDLPFAANTPLVISTYQVSDAAATRAPTIDFYAGVFFSDDESSYNNTNYTNVKYTASSNSLSPSDGNTRYWQSRKNLTVVSYAPYTSSYQSSKIDHEIKEDQSNEKDYTASDLIYAKTSDISFGSNISLEYTHLNSQLIIMLKPDGKSISQSNWNNITDLSVKVLNTLTSGELTISTGIMSEAKRQGTIIPYQNSNRYEAIILPQTIDEDTDLIEISFNFDSAPYTFIYTVPKGKSQTFESRKSYTYSITVSRSGIESGIPSISEWDIGSTTDGTTDVDVVYYGVGDYYPDPENASTATGVVFWIDPNADGYNTETKSGKHGKMVSLKDLDTKAWGPRKNNTNANSTENGLDNMITITTKTNWANSYPAFNTVHSLNNMGTTYTAEAKGVWYLPSIGELQYFLCAATGHDPETWWTSNSGSHYPSFYNKSSFDLSRFNTLFTNADGTGLNKNYYWSSTENTNDTACTIYFGNGYSGSGTKNNSFNVRAISAF